MTSVLHRTITVRARPTTPSPVAMAHEPSCPAALASILPPHSWMTLPLKGFDVVPGVGNYIEFHAVNIHLDKHAYEKWNQ